MQKIKIYICEVNVEGVVLKGDILLIRNRKDLYQLITICPGCGLKIASLDSNEFNFKTKSYSALISHDSKLGGCGWTGDLKYGFLKRNWKMNFGRAAEREGEKTNNKT